MKDLGEGGERRITVGRDARRRLKSKGQRESHTTLLFQELVLVVLKARCPPGNMGVIERKKWGGGFGGIIATTPWKTQESHRSPNVQEKRKQRGGVQERGWVVASWE